MNIRRIKHIDGLRAIAVVFVILYHSFPKYFPNSYIGVDYFLVISGFIISKKYFLNYEEKFLFLEFWRNRIYRIYPQLLTCIFICFVIGFFAMQPEYFENFSQNSIASLLSLNNILLFFKGGYWRIQNEVNPLFTTWSLGLEIQFYLLFSIILVNFYSNKKTNHIKIFYILSILSLILSGFGSIFFKNANYLLLPSRFWEFSLGIIASFFSKNEYKFPKNIVNFSFFLILIPLLIPYETINYSPNPFFIFPLFGVACICINQENSFINKILSSKPFVYVGLSSYSIYIYHQPVLAFARISTYYELKNLNILFLILFSFAFGFFMYELIERKAILNLIPDNLYSIFITNKFLISIFSILFTINIYSVISKGMVKIRFDNILVNDFKIPKGLMGGKGYTEEPYEYLFKEFPIKQEFSKNTKNLNILIIGRSKARDLINSFKILDKKVKNLSFSFSYSEYLYESINYENQIKVLEFADLIIIEDDSIITPISVLNYSNKLIALKERENFAYTINPAFYSKKRSNINIENRDKRFCKNEQTFLELTYSGNYKYRYFIDTQCAFNNDFNQKQISDSKGRLFTFDGIHLSYEGADRLADTLKESNNFINLLKKSANNSL